MNYPIKNMSHQFYVDLLYKRLSSWDFDYMEKNVPYDHGEIDILAKFGNVLFDFEVKCSNKHRKRGESQLHRWRSYLNTEDSNNPRAHGFLYIGNEDLLDFVF